MTSLKASMADSRPLYEIPDDDLVGDVLIPAMRASKEVRIAAGFFSSRCFAQISAGLADFVANSDQPLRILASPEISDDDWDAIDCGLKTPEEVLERTALTLIEGARISESALARHTLDCLSYLVASGRLNLRLVLMVRGMYHKKQWLFQDDETTCAVHGSGNVTTRGLLVNGEQMTVDKPWSDGLVAERRVALLSTQWDRQWENKHPHSLTITAEQGLLLAGSIRPPESMPTIDDFWQAWRRDAEAGLESTLPPGLRSPPEHLLRIPSGMEWRTGPYGHQGRAVDAFLGIGGKGVLAIATGGGKTKTALISATQLQDQHQGPFAILILVPSKPLMLQWAEEVRDFGIEPVLPSLSSRANRTVLLQEILASLSNSNRRTEVIIATNQLFGRDAGLRETLADLPSGVLTMLVADEMHNLGTPTFLTATPDFFQHRLGLSATPVRQYDPDGTDKLFGFFGPTAFEFSLAEAIEAGCPTPYDYHIHPVALTADEMDKHTELTEELRACGRFAADDGRTIEANPKAERLLRERRAILEQAAGKIDLLTTLLRSIPKVARTLIYTSAKPAILTSGRQLDAVNELLADLGIVSHQFTNAETSRSDAQEILDSFGAGDYAVLTAMKVLDEGIDIPQTDTAFLMASSTVVREWVQRRGRILRKSGGKTMATLHDFLVVPPDPISAEGISILKGELRRAEEFAFSPRTSGPRVAQERS